MGREDKPQANGSLRARVIDSVRTPIGFFALVVLVAEGLLGAVAIFIDRPEKTYLVYSMILLIFLLTIIVALFAVFRPEALQGLRPSLVVLASDIPKVETKSSIDQIAQKESIPPDQVDPKLVRFIPPLSPTKFKIVDLPRPQPPPYFNWPYSPTGNIVIYDIPFFLLPVTDSESSMKGHLVVDVQPSQKNDSHQERLYAGVTNTRSVHFLISAGHGWRVHEGVQFLNRRIGYLRFAFHDGTELRKDLILGKHLREWAFGNSTDLVTELDQSLAKPAWLSHDSTRRFDLLTISFDGQVKHLEFIDIVAKFEDDHPDKLISIPSIIITGL
jgi:hypothetical protein